MFMAEKIKQHLARCAVTHERISHSPSKTLQQAADLAKIAHNEIARSLVLTDGKALYMVIIPLSHVLDFARLREMLGTQVALVPLAKLTRVFPDCEPGSIPVLGQLYGLKVVIDQYFKEIDRVYFEPGLRSCWIQMTGRDFVELHKQARWEPISLPVQRLSQGSGANPTNANPNTMDLEPIPADTLLPVNQVKTRVSGIYELPPMPAMAIEILKLGQKPDATITELAKIVEMDPSLAAQVMRYASSAFFGYRGKIDSIQDAISRVLGFEPVMNIALGLAAGKSLRNSPDGPLGLQAFWRHAMFSAAMTQGLGKLATKEIGVKPGLAYLAGLLHNFGFLLLGHLFQPEFFMLNKLVAANPKTPITHLEKQIIGMGQAKDLLGMGHANMGAWLMETWNMPDEIVIALREHHNLDYQGEHAVYAQLVNLTDRLLCRYDIGDGDTVELPASLLQALGISKEQALMLLESTMESAEGLESMARQLAA